LRIRGHIRSSRCTTSLTDTGGKWKISSIRKVLSILFGHLWVVERRYKQSDIVPIIATGGKFATGVNDTSSTGGKFAVGVVDAGSAR
jgi:hypothetical protein